MRIGLDARPLISSKPSGIGNYLIEVLKEISKENTNNEIYLYTNQELKNSELDLSRFNVRLIPGKIGTLWLCFGLRKSIEQDRIDVFWGTQHMLPLNIKGIKQVVTIHDLALLINPNWGSYVNAFMQNVFARMSCKKADRILTDSLATAKDVNRMLGIPNERIVPILLGNGKIPFSKKSIINVIEKEYFLYIGTIEPRKNILNIVKGYELYRKKSGDKRKLILAGGMGWKFKPIIKHIQKSKYKDDIYMMGYVSNEEKAFLLKNTKCFLFPSNYEGFGFPILEAMSFGVPVITSNVSSMPEVGGDLAFYVDKPGEPQCICRKLQEVVGLNEDQLSDLAKKEVDWCNRFSWENCARRTVYEIVNT